MAMPCKDSRVIMEYLCHVAGNSVLIPDDGVKRFRILTLQALGLGLGDAAGRLRYETAARPCRIALAGMVRAPQGPHRCSL